MTAAIVGLSLLVAILLIVAVLMQKPEKEGFIEGMSGASEQHQKIKFKARGFDKTIIKITYVLGFLLMTIFVVNLAVA